MWLHQCMCDHTSIIIMPVHCHCRWLYGTAYNTCDSVLCSRGCSLLAIRRPSGGWGTAISPGHWMAYATDWPIQMMQHCCWLQLYLPSHNSSIGWMAVCHSPNGVRIAITPGRLHEKCAIHQINHWARKVSSSVKSDKMSLYTYSYVYVLRQNLIIKIFTVVK